jgi:catechol 2,3-dioxygenase-like lactoylglutathione lyase family enzyme
MRSRPCLRMRSGASDLDNRAMARIQSVNLHVEDLDRAAGFWAAALGYRARGDESDDATPVLVAKDGAGPAIVLDTDDRTHLDLAVADPAEQRVEVERLISLGARRVAWDYADGADHVVLVDPEGNLFCVVVDRAGT